MGIILKQSLKGSIYTYLGVILGFITTGLLFPHIFSTEQLGLTRIIVAYSTLFSQVGTLGVNGATIRLFPYFRGEDKKHNGYVSILLIAGTLGSILSISILFLLKPYLLSKGTDHNGLLNIYFETIAPLILFNLFFSLFDVYYAALHNSARGIFLKEVLQRIFIISVIGLYYFKRIEFNAFIWLYVVSICLPTLIIVLALIREGQFNIRPNWSFMTKPLLRTFLTMSFYSILTNFSSILLQNVDSVMVNKMLGLDALGIYTVTFLFGMLVNMPSRATNKIISIMTAEAWKKNDVDTIRKIYHKSCLNLYLIGLLLFIGLWTNVDNLFHILPADYSSGKWVIFFIGLSGLVDMATGSNAAILGTSKRYKVQSYFMLTLVALAIVSNLIFIPILGLNGAALASFISMALFNLIRLFYLYFRFGLQPYSIKFIWITLLGAAAYLLSSLPGEMNNFIVDILVRSTIIVTVFLVPVYFFRFSPELTEKVDEYLQLVRKFVKKEK